MKILVALLGGIDSSVVAHLLAEQGHELVGVRFTLWTDPLAPALAEILPSKCCNAQTAARAARVAEDLNIPYHILDLEEDFKRDVVDPFLEGYAKGTTPNPCIGCNRSLKFGRLLDFMEEQGCEKLATGHYARVAVEQIIKGEQRDQGDQGDQGSSVSSASSDSSVSTKENQTFILLEAIDTTKDQSYYLYGLDQSQLSKVLFPLGSMHKSDIFALAEHFHVPYDSATYRESQDLCFFPEKEPKEFLKRHLDLQPGEIVRRDGTVMGEHRGLPLYTIGQRRIGVGGLQIPLEVVAKDTATNRLIVSQQGDEMIDSVALKELRWVSWSPNQCEPTAFECRTRSHGDRLRGSINYKESEGIFTFNAPTSPQAEGQSLVLYRGEEVVGGGVMHETCTSPTAVQWHVQGQRSKVEKSNIA